MTRPQDRQPSSAERSADDRVADHAAIDRLAEELVPALIAKLSASGLGEIEVSEGDWTIRVRRPGDGTPHNRRSTDRGLRSGSGHAHTAAGFDSHRATRETRPAAGSVTISANGTGAGAAAATIGAAHDGDGADPHRAVATSPAVGVFQPRSEARAGTRVRSGDRLGAVDLLGVPQEVVAPADGIVGATLVEPGQAVEYGQELIVIELAGRPERGDRTDRGERSDG